MFEDPGQTNDIVPLGGLKPAGMLAIVVLVPSEMGLVKFMVKSKYTILSLLYKCWPRITVPDDPVIVPLYAFLTSLYILSEDQVVEVVCAVSSIKELFTQLPLLYVRSWPS